MKTILKIWLKLKLKYYINKTVTFLSLEKSVAIPTSYSNIFRQSDVFTTFAYFLCLRKLAIMIATSHIRI